MLLAALYQAEEKQRAWNIISRFAKRNKREQRESKGEPRNGGHQRALKA